MNKVNLVLLMVFSIVISLHSLSVSHSFSTPKLGDYSSIECSNVIKQYVLQEHMESYATSCKNNTEKISDLLFRNYIIGAMSFILFIIALVEYFVLNKYSLKCPACRSEIDRDTLNRMNPLFGGPIPSMCDNCKQAIQWHSDLHTKIRYSAIVFKVGLFIIVAALICIAFVDSNIPRKLVALGGIIAVVGVLLAPTGPRRGRIEKI